MDPVRLEIYKHLFSSIPEEMGIALRRSSFSPNIKERLDFSCALFDRAGAMVAQAAHIPVHLGAMPLSVRACMESLDFNPGDMAILNHPFQGGTHLPDITLVMPIFANREKDHGIVGFLANRAHHSDVGGMSSGSMPIASEIYQEGLVIPPSKIMKAGTLNRSILDLILANVRTPDERKADLRAQIAANRLGSKRMNEYLSRYGVAEVESAMAALLKYSEQMMRTLIQELPDGVYEFYDQLDNDGINQDPVRIQVSIKIQGSEVWIDFNGSSEQCPGSVNAVYPITLSATLFVFRSLLGADVPTNSGCLLPIHVHAPEGTVVNALPPAAVSGGNVETSQRITDVLLGALAKACPERIPAASQGSMNNLALGGWDPFRRKSYAYYETIGGGMGGRPGRPGASGIHTHMTNTLNTPIEALEFSYPLQIAEYRLREGSGGDGQFPGGEGIVRVFRFLADSEVSILSERRIFQPYGLLGGEPGKTGQNFLKRDGELEELPGKIHLQVKAGDSLLILTPGGGGYGKPAKKNQAEGGTL
jgi:N-methylhydantoinase B